MAKIDTYVRARDAKMLYRGRPTCPLTGDRLPSRSFETESDARRYVATTEAKAALDAGVVATDTPRRRVVQMAWPTFVDHWLDTYLRGETNSRNAARSHCRQLAAEWPAADIADIDAGMVQRYMSRLEAEGKGASTRASRLSFLRQMMTRAVDEGRRADNPCRDMRSAKQPRSVRVQKRTLTPGEIERIMMCLPDWLAPAVLISADSGLRVGEVCGLRWASASTDMRMIRVGDVVLQDGTVRAYPKGKEILTVPMSQRAAKALIELRKRTKGKDNDFVFTEPRYNGAATNPHRVKVLWRSARKRAWIEEPVRWHDLRHGCAHALVASGANMLEVQAVMRHADLSTSQNYMPSVSTAAMRSAVDRAAG